MTNNRTIADLTDFGSFANRITLAQAGIFSVDTTAHKAQRAAERQEEARLDTAYSTISLDRQGAYKAIASRIEAKSFNGVWARSTGEYGAAVASLDRLTTNRAAQYVMFLGLELAA